MLYVFYELNHAALAPVRAAAHIMGTTFRSPLNPLSRTPFGKSLAASASLFERTTRRYGKPDFGIDTVEVDSKTVAVTEECVWGKPFCRLLHFKRDLPARRKPDPKLIIVAPMSGHYATLLRGTVQTMSETHDVYITDWVDARMVPVSEGTFGLDDYIDYLIEILHLIGPNANVMAVCQPSVPVIAAVSLMEEDNDPMVPASMTLMGGPIDTRINPTAVNRLAEERGMDWFRNNVIVRVPFPHPGTMRAVYPGFLQLTGFMSMNLDRHVNAHKEFYWHLVEGDGDSADSHEAFYDEYLAVMDLDAEFYLDTVEAVFVRHALPKGELTYRGRKVDPGAIRNVALMTVEGERDDISGVGQTEAAHSLCRSLPEDMKLHHLQEKVGHYGVFNGRRFQSHIAPAITGFIAAATNRRAKAQNDPQPTAQIETTISNGTATGGTNQAAAPATDDLKRIAGIGPALEKKLKSIGLSSFADIASLTPDGIIQIDKKLAFRGRIQRENWVAQAQDLRRL